MTSNPTPYKIISTESTQKIIAETASLASAKDMAKTLSTESTASYQVWRWHNSGFHQLLFLMCNGNANWRNIV